MTHLVVGIAALVLGVWAMLANWMIFAEVVAVLAGVRRLRAPNTKRPATESTESTEVQ